MYDNRLFIVVEKVVGYGGGAKYQSIKIPEGEMNGVGGESMDLARATVTIGEGGVGGAGGVFVCGEGE